MDSVRSKVLSALLLCFVFLSFHDYLGFDSLVHAKNEVCCEASCVVDDTHQLHESLHSLFVVPNFQTIRPSEHLKHQTPFHTEHDLVSMAFEPLLPPPLA